MDVRKQKHLHELRLHELEKALQFFPSKGRILELGAGAGWQALELEKKGYSIVGVDLKDSRFRKHLVFPVLVYDGTRIPFCDNSFDAVFSSNVLEHVVDLEAVLFELDRVLKPGGTSIHIVPSSTWRLYTLLTHHIYLVKSVFELFVRKNDKRVSIPSRDEKRGKTRSELFKTIFIPNRHGEEGNAFSEMFAFSQKGWESRLERFSISIDSIRPTGVFYTGGQIFGGLLSIRMRRWLAERLGSATLILSWRSGRE